MFLDRGAGAFCETADIRRPSPSSLLFMVELPDTAGLICGFRLRPDGPAESLKWDAAGLGQGFDGAVWLHFSLADVRAQKWIAACEQIPAQARELLLNNDPHIRMEAAGRGFAGVLGDLHFEFDADPDRLGVLRLYVDEDIVVTARLHPLKAADLLRLEVRGGAAFESTTSLVIRFVEGVTDILTAVAAGQGEIVDEIEDRVLKDRFLRESEELGPVRRLLARLRRQVDAQRHALGHLAHRPPGWFRDKDTGELRRSIERLGGVSQDLESIQERARLLQEEIAGRLGKATNQNLYIVSLLTAIFLPITLITGIFGMNVGGLPGVDQDTGFAWVIGLMILTVVTSLVLLHWRRFF